MTQHLPSPQDSTGPKPSPVWVVLGSSGFIGGAVCSGLRLALAQSWLFLVAAELIASSMGLGFLLTDSQNNGRTDRMFLAIVLLAVIGKTTDALLGVAEKWAVKKWA